MRERTSDATGPSPSDSLSNGDFARLRKLIHARSGIHLGESKRTMLESRLRRRIRSLNLGSYRKYCDYLFGADGLREEMVHFIDVVTTNKTDFFREPDHFRLLVQKAIPDLLARARPARPLVFWSAGCSTGEEPYTLAMVLTEYAGAHPGFAFKVLATDISTAVLAKAERGVFSEDQVRPVPPELRKRYFMRSRDPASGLVRVVPELRQTIEFRSLNFMDDDFGMSERVDALFCRNVIIYFERPIQEQVLQKLSRHLVPGGYAFMGHAESLHDMDLPWLTVGPALYRKEDVHQ
jgi:chemotaxis protein methyltransferase CheR